MLGRMDWRHKVRDKAWCLEVWDRVRYVPPCRLGSRMDGVTWGWVWLWELDNEHCNWTKGGCHCGVDHVLSTVFLAACLWAMCMCFYTCICTTSGLSNRSWWYRMKSRELGDCLKSSGNWNLEGRHVRKRDNEFHHVKEWFSCDSVRIRVRTSNLVWKWRLLVFLDVHIPLHRTP